ncbi:MAG: response regulator transcription factor [Erysipelotrichaceae bacterium]|nr:response regulator transcription factor [Erysipelotrichaceae bacterium]
MLEIVLCDDDQYIIDHYKDLLDRVSAKLDVPICVRTYNSGEQLLFDIEDHKDVDIIYLDVLMGKMNGIETGSKLRKMGCNAQIIFLTTSKEYVFDAFDVKPLQYLIKDEISEERFEQVFKMAVAECEQKEKECYVITKGKETIKVAYADIYHFEVQGRVVTCHTEAEDISFYSKFDDVVKELETKGFIRCHRAYLVNARYIKRIQTSELILKNGDIIPIATGKTNAIKQQFAKYLSASMKG